MRPATARELEELRLRRNGQKPKWDWPRMSQIPGRTFTLEEYEDFEFGRAANVERSARRWAGKRGIKLSVHHDEDAGKVFVTFWPPHAKKPTKWEAAMASGAWVSCAHHEQPRARRHAEAAAMDVEFKNRQARFIPRSPSDAPASTS